MTDTELARKELLKNNYTWLTLPQFKARIIKPYPALLLKYGIIPSIIYQEVLKVAFPEAALAVIHKQQFEKPEDPTDRVIKVVCEIILEPDFTAADFLALEGELGMKAQLLLIQLATGKLEQVIPEDLVGYAKTNLKHDALSSDTPVSQRLGLSGTITGYDLDMAAGLFKFQREQEMIKLQIEAQASMMGYQMLGV